MIVKFRKAADRDSYFRVLGGDGPFMVLGADDPHVPELLRRWIELRRQALLTGARPLRDMEKICEATAALAAIERRTDVRAHSRLASWCADVPSWTRHDPVRAILWMLVIRLFLRAASSQALPGAECEVVEALLGTAERLAEKGGDHADA